MKRILALVIGVLVTLSLVPAGAAGARGGWATSTLDPLPPLEPGETADIGFTVRQHGVTPVDLTEFGTADVGIAFDAAGDIEFFAAEAQGAIGHYVASVVVPDAGSYEWEVRQGWFAPQPLGTIQLDAADPAVALPSTDTGGDRAWLDVVQWSSIGLTLGLALMVAVDVVRSRRHRSVAQPS
jgi:hypothetical protein